MISFSNRDPALTQPKIVRPYESLPFVDASEEIIVDGPIATALSVHTQTTADSVPGEILSIRTGEGVVFGRTYQIGIRAAFIGQKVDLTPVDDKFDPTLDLRRSIDARKTGEWFEHVYPFGEADPEKIAGKLQPLADFAKSSGTFFVAACIDGACVVMPAVRDKSWWSQGVSKRYAAYANATDGNGQLATQAMILIDPGEESGYTDSQEIGVMDKDIPEASLL